MSVEQKADDVSIPNAVVTQGNVGIDVIEDLPDIRFLYVQLAGDCRKHEAGLAGGSGGDIKRVQLILEDATNHVTTQT